uniref:Uncharacterized protein n=1 Tax=Panagrolaimus davidi TaxID=227884 RepID=A0A914QU75_9BILA
MNSTNFDEKNDNENHPPNMNSSFSTEEESGPSESKKRKLSIGVSPSLAAIKLKMLQIENDELKKVVEKLDKENTDLKQNKEEPLKSKILFLTSTINDYEEKV